MLLTPIAVLLVVIDLIARVEGPVSKGLQLILLVVAGILVLIDLIRPFVGRAA